MVIAKIFDYEITDVEYQKELQKIMHKNKVEQPNKELKLRAIDHLVDGYLLKLQAQRLHVDVCKDAIESKLLDMMMDFDSEESFNEMLKQKGITHECLRKKFEEELKIKKYIETFCTTEFDISEEQLESIYKENINHFKTEEMIKVSHILIKDNSNEGAKKANDIRKKIATPEDFKFYVEECSECPSGCNCGDLGFIKKGKMVVEFEDAAFSLAVNEISRPIKTAFGYHIILKTEHRAEEIAKFENVKEALFKRLAQINQELHLLRHLKKLRESATIEVYEDRI